MEKSVVKNLEKSGKVLAWIRYADDVLVVAKKASIDFILNKINSWSGKLKFTMEEMESERLKFLDTEVFLDNSKIRFRKYQKTEKKRLFPTISTTYRPKSTFAEIY